MATLIRRSNGIYYLVSYQGGKRQWRSTGARRKADAERAVRNLALNPPENPLPRGITLSELALKFQPYARTNLAPGTATPFA